MSRLKYRSVKRCRGSCFRSNKNENEHGVGDPFPPRPSCPSLCVGATAAFLAILETRRPSLPNPT
jgi:hypothetical protein